MNFKNELLNKKLTKDQIKFLKTIDEKLLEWLEDIEKNKIYDISEIKTFFNKKDFICDKKNSWVLI